MPLGHLTVTKGLIFTTETKSVITSSLPKNQALSSSSNEDNPKWVLQGSLPVSPPKSSQ